MPQTKHATVENSTRARLMLTPGIRALCPVSVHSANTVVVHGLLHLLGHDHAAEAEAAEMEGTEISILSALGYPDPYVALPETAE